MSDNESVIEQERPVNTVKFKDHVREWITIYDRIAILRKDITLLNKRKNEIGTKIVTYMNHNEKELCNLGDQGTLFLKKGETKQALKKEDIADLLIQMGKHNELEAKEIADFLMNNKRKKAVEKLQRSTKML